MSSGETNAEQVAYWNDAAGEKWVRYQEDLDTQIGPLGEAALERLAVSSGEQVIDIGCGCGGTTAALVKLVAPDGTVVGIDISEPMLGRARERLAQTPGVSFLRADAQTHAFAPASADAVFSRFGVMFFEDPAAAFANIATALRPGGRMGFVCWQTIAHNWWMSVPMAAAAKILEFPATDPLAPGPFAFADPARVESLLTKAGLDSVEIEPLNTALTLAGGQDLDATTEFLLEIGPAARALREQGQHHRPAVAAAVREALAPYRTPTGVRMNAAVWLVTAIAR